MSQMGKFLTLEGVDGAGKSTHCDWLVEQLKAHNVDVVFTREPGGTDLGESLRTLLLNQDMDLKTEALLVFAARREHINQVIIPALEAGKWVLCDRFTDATYAYQGGGRGLSPEDLQWLEHWVVGQLEVTRTWLFDLPLALAQERMRTTRQLDRFEQEDEAFFLRTQEAYHARARQAPARFKCIDSALSIAQIRAILSEDLMSLIAQ